MVRRPRNTDKFQQLAASTLQDLQDTRKHPVIGPAWESARAALARTIAHGTGKQWPLSDAEGALLWAESAQDRAAFQDCLARLRTLIDEHAPTLLQVFGPWLEENLGICFFAELGLEKPAHWGQRTERRSPKNPIRRLGKNIYYIPEDVAEYQNAAHRRQCLLELDGHFQALQAARPPGRPRATAKGKPSGPPEKLDTHRAHQAIKAYELEQAQKDKGQKRNWKEIAEALGKSVPLHDQLAQKRLYAQIDRLVSRGRLLAQARQQ